MKPGKDIIHLAKYDKSEWVICAEQVRRRINMTVWQLLALALQKELKKRRHDIRQSDALYKDTLHNHARDNDTWQKAA
jgi:hypothetical protein